MSEQNELARVLAEMDKGCGSDSFRRGDDAMEAGARLLREMASDLANVAEHSSYCDGLDNEHSECLCGLSLILKKWSLLE